MQKIFQNVIEERGGFCWSRKILRMLPLCHQEQNVSGSSSSSRNIVGYSSKLKVEAQPRLSGKSIVFKALANLCLPAVDEKSSKTREIEADATPTNTLLLLCYYPPPTQEAAFLLYSMIKKTFGRMHFPFFFTTFLLLLLLLDFDEN